MQLEDLKYWRQRVGTGAFSIEEGLLRFEVYQVTGEDALVIHGTFKNSDELKFHLSKGSAENDRLEGSSGTGTIPTSKFSVSR